MNNHDTALPFVACRSQAGEGEALPHSVEVAIALAQLWKGPRRPLTSAARIYWPLHFVNLEQGHYRLLVDGMGIASATVSEFNSPDTGEGLESLCHQAPSVDGVEAFSQRLHDFISELTYRPEAKSHQLHGGLRVAGCLPELQSYFQMGAAEDPSSASTTLQCRNPADAAAQMADFLATLRQRAKEDVAALQHRVNVLKLSLQGWRQCLQVQAQAIQDTYSRRIARVQPDVEHAVAKYERQQGQEVHTIEMRYSPKISALEAEVSKWQREEEHLSQSGSSYHAMKLSARKAKKDAILELTRTTEDRDNAIREVRERYGKGIREEQEKIHVLERSRDKETADIAAQTEELAESAASLTKSMECAIAEREAHIRDLEEIVLPFFQTAASATGSTLALLPIWVGIIPGKRGEEIMILSPAWVREQRRWTESIKSLFTKTSIPMDPCCGPVITPLRQSMADALESDAALRDELVQKVKASNIFTQTGAREMVQEGLDWLKLREWVSSERVEEILRAFGATRDTHR